jgi:hypothetical protein
MNHADTGVSHGGEVEGGRFHDDGPNPSDAWVHRVTPRVTAEMSHPLANRRLPSPHDVAANKVSPLMSRCLNPAIAGVGISMTVAQIGGGGCNGSGDGDCGGNSGEWWQRWCVGLGSVACCPIITTVHGANSSTAMRMVGLDWNRGLKIL